MWKKENLVSTELSSFNKIMSEFPTISKINMKTIIIREISKSPGFVKDELNVKTYPSPISDFCISDLLYTGINHYVIFYR